MKTLGDFAKI